METNAADHWTVCPDTGAGVSSPTPEVLTASDLISSLRGLDPPPT